MTPTILTEQSMVQGLIDAVAGGVALLPLILLIHFAIQGLRGPGSK